MHHSPRAVNIAALCLYALITAVTTGNAQTQAVNYLTLQNLSGFRGGNLTAAIDSDPSTFNSMMASSFPSVVIAGRISADLVHINRESFALEPSLAERWELDKDGRSYTLHLRP